MYGAFSCFHSLGFLPILRCVDELGRPARLGAHRHAKLTVFTVALIVQMFWINPAVMADSGAPAHPTARSEVSHSTSATDDEWEPSTEERRLLALINLAREQERLRPVTLDAVLSRIARAHAREMIQSGYFGHVSPRSGSVGNRLREAGVSFDVAAENLAGHLSPKRAHLALMNSDPHRRNILLAKAAKVGLAYVPGGPYGAMIVQIFIVSKAEFVTQN